MNTNTAPVSDTATVTATVVEGSPAVESATPAAPKLAALVAQNPDVVAAAAALKAAKVLAAAALKPAVAPKAPARKKSDAINLRVKVCFSTDTKGRFVRAEMRDGHALGLDSGVYFVPEYAGTRGRDGNGILTLEDASMGVVAIDWRTALDDANNGANPALLSLEIVTSLSDIRAFCTGEVAAPATVTASVEVSEGSEVAPLASPDYAEVAASLPAGDTVEA
jgi:hypothetical protein